MGIHQFTLATQAQAGGGGIIAVEGRGGEGSGKNRAQDLVALTSLGHATGLPGLHRLGISPGHGVDVIRALETAFDFEGGYPGFDQFADAIDQGKIAHAQNRVLCRQTGGRILLVDKTTVLRAGAAVGRTTSSKIRHEALSG